MRTPRTTSRADLDLLQIWAFIAQDSLENADKLIDQLHVKFEQLAKMPESGATCDDIEPGLRRSTTAGYVIYYRITDIDAEILRVVHGARNLRSLFD